MENLVVEDANKDPITFCLAISISIIQFVIS